MNNKLAKKVFTLHRYFIWSNRLLLAYENAVKTQGSPPEDIEELDLWTLVPYGYMSYWLASLYVVVDGYKELDIHDSNIDGLLASPFENSLRRYRNGVFHYQEKYYDERFSDFMEHGEDSLQWAVSLHDAFGDYFLVGEGRSAIGATATKDGDEYTIYFKTKKEYDRINNKINDIKNKQ